jgi:hypothetical protein
MHFHLPKPLHGWRAFAGEVGIIVVGVLIALAAEQVVDEWRWDQKVAVVRKSLMGELGNDRARWEINTVSERCIDHDIGLLQDWAAKGGKSAPPSVPNFEKDDIYWMHWADWTLATGGETLDHFPIDQQLAFASLYDGIAHRQVDIEKGQDLAERAATLIPLATDAQGRRELLIALGPLSAELGSLLSNDAYMTRHFDALDVKPDRSDFAADIRPNCAA